MKGNNHALRRKLLSRLQRISRMWFVVMSSVTTILVVMTWEHVRKYGSQAGSRSLRGSNPSTDYLAKYFLDAENDLHEKVRSHSQDFFEMAFNDMYHKAIDAPSLVQKYSTGTGAKEETTSDSKSMWKRYRFDLSQWTNKTSGGLVNEDRELLGQLYFNASSVFEFGLGESTYIASETNVPRYAGVDSDPAWVALAREGATAKPILNVDGWTPEEALRKGAHFRFYFADLGPLGEWGFPQKIESGDEIHRHIRKFTNALNYQFTALRVEQEPFDFYLVDGRYRTACALLSFLHAMRYQGDMTKILVAIHDANRHRGYDALLNVADITHKTRRLWVLRLKPTTTQQDVMTLWEQYRFDKG